MVKTNVLDYLIQHGYVADQREAEVLIMAGKVHSQERRFNSIHEILKEGETLRIKQDKRRYVSRGGDKLATVFQCFSLNITGKTGIDFGASTGGFTDYLLQHGAGRIVAVDVGYGILADKLQQHPDVIQVDRTNIRNLDIRTLNTILSTHNRKSNTAVQAPFDFAVADLSFISLTTLLPVFHNLLKPQADLLVLFKPQFEAEQHQVPAGGVIADKKLVDHLRQDFINHATHDGFIYQHHELSGIKGQKGNQEIFIHFRKLK